MLQIFYLVLTIFVGLLLSFIAHLMYFQIVCFSARCEEATAISRGFNWSVLNDSSWRCCDLFESQSRQDEVMLGTCLRLRHFGLSGEKRSRRVSSCEVANHWKTGIWVVFAFGLVTTRALCRWWLNKISADIKEILSEKRIYSHIPSSLLLSIYRWNNQPYQILRNA